MADALTNRASIQPVEDQTQDLVPASETPPPRPEDQLPDEGMMTLREHLFELRDRVVRAALGIVAGTALGFWFAGTLLKYFQEAICPPGVTDCRLQIIDPTEGLVVYFKIAIYVGVALSLPITLYQLIRFVVPGLTSTEKRVLFIALPFVSILFVVGSAFAMTTVIPAMIRFLGGFGIEWFRPDFRATPVLALALNVTLWMGLVFEMPLVMVILTKLGVVTWQKLLSWWRYALVIILILSAIITPTPDPVNMMMVAGPMTILYALGIILARIFATRQPRPPAPAPA